VTLSQVVKKDLFTPPPKVDSQAVVLTIKHEPVIPENEQTFFFKIVKAGFSAKRKKLRSSLPGGLGISVKDAEKILFAAGINPDLRAESLSIQDWIRLTRESKIAAV